MTTPTVQALGNMAIIILPSSPKYCLMKNCAFYDDFSELVINFLNTIMFTEIDQEILDIDWFFTDKTEIGFVASGGGTLPNSFAKIEKHELLVSYFRSLPEISDVILNENLNTILSHEIDDNYLNDFVFFSRRGLYAFDKTNLGMFSDTNYHLVGKPANAIKINDLPEEIKSILTQTQIHRELKELLHIDITEIE